MSVLKTTLIVMLVSGLSVSSGRTENNGPTFFTFTSNTGNDATIILTEDVMIEVNGSAIEPGDEIGAFTPDSLCVGAVVWQNESTAFPVWGNNEQTPDTIDGLLPGEQIHFRVWRKSENSEYSQSDVRFSGDPPATSPDGTYSPNAIIILDSLTANDYIVGMNENGGVTDIPQSFELDQNYPNPFNPETTIGYSIPHSTHVRIVVFNTVGQHIETLVDRFHQPGRFFVQFNSRGHSSGVYYYRMEAGDFTVTRKFVLLR